MCIRDRSLYGLRQAGRQWYAKLSTFLLSNNYSISVADHSLFLKYNNDKLTVILVYVDDLVLTGDDTEEINTTSRCRCHFPIQKTPWTSHLLNQHATRHRLRCPQFKPIHITKWTLSLTQPHKTGSME